MTYFFGSFLVTQCALTSCHVMISKQGSTIRAVGYNRCVTGRRPRDENHAVRFRGRRESQSSEGHAADQRCLGLQGVESVGTPGSRKKTWKKSSLWVYVSPSISPLISPPITNCGPFSRIKWEIYLYKEVCCVRSLSLIMFPLVFVLRLFNNMIEQQMRFTNVLAYNNPGLFNMPLKSINQSYDSNNYQVLIIIILIDYLILNIFKQFCLTHWAITLRSTLTRISTAV